MVSVAPQVAAPQPVVTNATPAVKAQAVKPAVAVPIAVAEAPRLNANLPIAPIQPVAWRQLSRASIWWLATQAGAR
jgi:hypothetical protein